MVVKREDRTTPLWVTTTPVLRWAEVRPTAGIRSLGCGLELPFGGWFNRRALEAGHHVSGELADPGDFRR